MIIEIKIPSVGESVQEAILAEWFKKDGEIVEKDEALFVIETDKVTLEVTAEASGKLAIAVSEGETVAIGAVVGTIDTEAAAAAGEAAEKAEEKMPEPKEAAPEKAEEKAPEPAKPAPEAEKPAEPKAVEKRTADSGASAPAPPSVRRAAMEKGVDLAALQGTGPGGSITAPDVIRQVETGTGSAQKQPPARPAADATASGGVIRKPMSPIRRRIADRLLEARQNTAMLTTFNEIDMGNAMDIRSRYKEAFAKKFNVGLGFMSFFTRACVEALKEIPEINAFIDGTDILYHDYQHIGIAVGSERGLVVPVIRHAEKLGFAEIEQAIVDYVAKIKANRLELADLEGGTFTISNGGVYGSLMSTPILNSPQSGILGLHKIEKRPVAVDDEIVIRPMMYVALSYDHRIVDGKGAVTFLKRVKEFVENPERMMLGI